MSHFINKTMVKLIDLIFDMGLRYEHITSCQKALYYMENRLFYYGINMQHGIQYTVYTVYSAQYITQWNKYIFNQVGALVAPVVKK